VPLDVAEPLMWTLLVAPVAELVAVDDAKLSRVGMLMTVSVFVAVAEIEKIAVDDKLETLDVELSLELSVELELELVEVGVTMTEGSVTLEDEDETVEVGTDAVEFKLLSVEIAVAETVSLLELEVAVGSAMEVVFKAETETGSEVAELISDELPVEEDGLKAELVKFAVAGTEVSDVSDAADTVAFNAAVDVGTAVMLAVSTDEVVVAAVLERAAVAESVAFDESDAVGVSCEARGSVAFEDAAGVTVAETSEAAVEFTAAVMLATSEAIVELAGAVMPATSELRVEVAPAKRLDVAGTETPTGRDASEVEAETVLLSAATDAEIIAGAADAAVAGPVIPERTGASKPVELSVEEADEAAASVELSVEEADEAAASVEKAEVALSTVTDGVVLAWMLAVVVAGPVRPESRGESKPASDEVAVGDGAASVASPEKAEEACVAEVKGAVTALLDCGNKPPSRPGFEELVATSAELPDSLWAEAVVDDVNGRGATTIPELVPAVVLEELGSGKSPSSRDEEDLVAAVGCTSVHWVGEGAAEAADGNSKPKRPGFWVEVAAGTVSFSVIVCVMVAVPSLLSVLTPGKRSASSWARPASRSTRVFGDVTSLATLAAGRAATRGAETRARARARAPDEVCIFMLDKWCE